MPHLGVPLPDTCPRCHKDAVLSDESPRRDITFSEPLCDDCRTAVVRELTMDSFDIAYERARAQGWSD